MGGRPYYLRQIYSVKIGIDTFACGGGKTAVGVYVTQLLKRIPPSGARFESFGWDYDRFVYSPAAPDIEFISRCRIKGNISNNLWHIFKYPSFAKSRSYDACFFPAAHKKLPFFSPCANIGVVHDASKLLINSLLACSLKRLDRIIAVSNCIKKELVERIKIKESLIEVVPNGIDHSAFYPRPRNEESVILIQPFSFRRPYVLCISRIEHPIKNHIRLIKAFEIFKMETKYPHRLILVGADSTYAKMVKKAVEVSPFKNDIFFTGHFPSKNLPELYSGADMVVVPSLYEGFGTGALEAMASGIPVICARSSSLPETAENAALYFDPYSPEDISARMIALSTNRDVYRECRRLGLERASFFSWDKCMERTLEIIQETVGK